MQPAEQLVSFVDLNMGSTSVGPDMNCPRLRSPARGGEEVKSTRTWVIISPISRRARARFLTGKRPKIIFTISDDRPLGNLYAT